MHIAAKHCVIDVFKSMIYEMKKKRIPIGGIILRKPLVEIYTMLQFYEPINL